MHLVSSLHTYLVASLLVLTLALIYERQENINQIAAQVRLPNQHQQRTSIDFDMKIAVLGASGCVGGFVVKHLVESGASVVLLNRRHLKEYDGNAAVEQHVIDLENTTNFKLHATGIVQGADAAVNTLGVGAPSKTDPATLRKVDVDLPTAFAEASKAAKIKHMALLTSVGADSSYSSSPSMLTGTGAGGGLYLHLKGKTEDNFAELGFASLSIFRPSTITGNPNTPWIMPRLHNLFNGLIPVLYHNVDAEDLGKSMAYQIRKVVEEERERESCEPAKPVVFEGTSLFELLAEASEEK